MRHPLLLTIVLVVFSRPLLAQVDSGPKPGSKVEGLKVFAATGESSGEELDFAAQQKDKQTIYAFVQADKWDRPVARYLKTIDEALAKSHPDVQVIAVWLTGDVEKAKAYLPKAQESLKMAQTIFAVHPGDNSGPAGWGINDQAHITVVVAKDAKVTANFAYRSVNETDSPALLKELK